MTRCALLLLAGVAACRAEVDELDGAFYDGDGRRVHCAVNLDSSAGISLESYDRAMDRAVARGEVVELYGHRPGASLAVATLEHVLAGAVARGLPFVTYGDFATRDVQGAGIAVSLDDSGIGEWTSVRGLFAQHGARVTFFVARYDVFTEGDRAQLRALADDGHDVQAHSVRHLRAPAYVEEHGLAAYMRDEALPSIEVLRADGYVVDAYAYPFGARTRELDEELLRHVQVLRSVEFPVHGPVSPCP